jgi:hypothetical protein
VCHSKMACSTSDLGHKQTFRPRNAMFAFQKRTFDSTNGMSALWHKADIQVSSGNGVKRT